MFDCCDLNQFLFVLSIFKALGNEFIIFYWFNWSNYLQKKNMTIGSCKNESCASNSNNLNYCFIVFFNDWQQKKVQFFKWRLLKDTTQSRYFSHSNCLATYDLSQLLFCQEETTFCVSCEWAIDSIAKMSFIPMKWKWHEWN